MYMKKYIFLAASALTLASCSSDDFLGDTPGSTPTSANSAINFGGDAGKISRATKNTGTAAEMLDGQFKIYGVKKTSDDKFKNVFVDYSVWDATANTTTSNTKGWEYVGANGATGLGTGNITLSKEQTIKYWDYASDNYHFVAGSPIANFTYLTNDNGNIESATVSGLGGHITANSGTTATTFNPVYVAKPKVVAKANYQEPVQFEFVRQQSMVRVGLYETIPGYSISSIKFYPYDDNKDAFSSTPSQNIVLTTTAVGYFKGGNNVSGKINYEWNTPKYTFEYETAGLTESKNWYGGKFTNGVPAIASTETGIEKLYGTDADMHANGYFTVLPTPSTTEEKPILIKCDYTLKSIDDSEETIEVKGATAAIPAAYSKWNTNTLYTYIFKISENTNGYTGDDSNKTGLYPITFDAAVKAPQFGMQGTVTTFTTPSITTYQEGSVEGNTIKYVADKNIDVTVLNDKAEVQTLKTTDEAAEQVGHIAVYKFDTEITEAEVQVKGVTSGTAVSGSVNNNVLRFTPSDAGWYAIQYLTTAAVGDKPAAYTYKVVYVAAAAN